MMERERVKERKTQENEKHRRKMNSKERRIEITSKRGKLEVKRQRERWMRSENMDEKSKKVFLYREAHKGFSQNACDVKSSLWHHL